MHSLTLSLLRRQEYFFGLRIHEDVNMLYPGKGMVTKLVHCTIETSKPVSLWNERNTHQRASGWVATQCNPKRKSNTTYSVNFMNTVRKTSLTDDRNLFENFQKLTYRIAKAEEASDLETPLLCFLVRWPLAKPHNARVWSLEWTKGLDFPACVFFSFTMLPISIHLTTWSGPLTLTAPVCLLTRNNKFLHYMDYVPLLIYQWKKKIQKDILQTIREA